MTHLLIAIDCTPSASEVVTAGLQLAANFPECKITLFHTILQPDYYASGQYKPILGFNENYNADISRLIEGGELEQAVLTFMANLKDQLNLEKAAIATDFGDPEIIIPEAIRNLGVDILVIGKQHRQKSKNRLGYVTEAVLKEIAIPTYVVPFQD